MIVGTDKTVLLGAKVNLIRPDAVVAEWTHRSIIPNEQFLYIAAKYVEADKANENKHFWSFEDLQKSQASITNSPLNVMHQPHNIVGVMTDSEFIYPEAFSPENEEVAAAYEYAKPHIEMLGVLWKWYFPQTVSQIEAAQEMGALHVSMECTAETVTRVNNDGSETEYPFMGGNLKAYDFSADSSHVQLNNPHFVGCGLVLPPAKPGWKGAEVRELMAAVDEDTQKSVYEYFEAESPHLTPEQWEDLMVSVLASAS